MCVHTQEWGKCETPIRLRFRIWWPLTQRCHAWRREGWLSLIWFYADWLATSVADLISETHPSLLHVHTPVQWDWAYGACWQTHLLVVRRTHPPAWLTSLDIVGGSTIVTALSLPPHIWLFSDHVVSYALPFHLCVLQMIPKMQKMEQMERTLRVSLGTLRSVQSW